MLLRDLIQRMPDAVVLGDPEVEVRSVVADSRQVQPGSLFVCIRGFKADGHQFAAQAYEKGAVALVMECGHEQSRNESPGGATRVLVADCRVAVGQLAAAFHQHPSDQLRIIGVTGTNGKTTTTHLIEAVLSRSGRPCGLIGTVGSRYGPETWVSHLTTPEPVELQQLLRRMADAGVEYATMEASSHALAQSRTAGCEFDAAVFTNLSRDHLDFHRDMDEYFCAKLKLFSSLSHRGFKRGPKVAALNRDDPRSAGIADHVAGRIDRVITYGLSGPADVQGQVLSLAGWGAVFSLRAPIGETVIHLRLPGLANVYNALAAATVGVAEGVSLDSIRGGLEGFSGVPGRFERVECGQDFSVIVDFAHNPGGVDHLMQTIKGLFDGRRIVVFGCKGEDSDWEKRQNMGRIVALHCDIGILTSDDPYGEDPGEIAGHVERGFAQGMTERQFRGGDPPPSCEVILDRREAISRAMDLARPGDTVVIAGRGHEVRQYTRGGPIPFDDRLVAGELLQQRMKQKTDERTLSANAEPMVGSSR